MTSDLEQIAEEAHQWAILTDVQRLTPVTAAQLQKWAARIRAWIAANNLALEPAALRKVRDEMATISYELEQAHLSGRIVVPLGSIALDLRNDVAALNVILKERE